MAAWLGPSGQTWAEEAITGDEGTGIEARFDTTQPAFPYPVARMIVCLMDRSVPSGMSRTVDSMVAAAAVSS